MTIGDAVAQALREWGDHPFLIEVSRELGAVEITSREFLGRISEYAARLRFLGVRQGYFVALFLENSADFVTIFLSLLHVGAVPVPVKLEYRKLELDEIFSNSRPEAVITARHHVPILQPYLAGVAVVVREIGSLSLLQAGDGRPPRQETPPDLASVNYTYRGYGYPLGAMIAHRHYLHGARALQDRLEGVKAEKMLILLPMAHIFGLVGCILVPLLNRMTAVVPFTMHPHQLFRHISDFRIDYVTSVPEVHSLLARVRDPAVDLSSLKAFVSGGSILTADSQEHMRRAFSIEVLHGYGLTEFAMVSGNIRGRTRPGTVGPPSIDVTCRIDSPGPGEAGEILIKADQVGGTYYGRPRETNEARSGPWFRTGDLGRLEGDCLVFMGELKNTRKINGSMVDLEEVARAIRQDPDVAEVHVRWERNELFARLGVRRDIEFGEKVKQIKTSLRGAIAGYKIPKNMSPL